MDNDKSKIVFILSTGHSGSTLLGMLAGMHPSLWTLGEIHYLPNGLKEKRKCSCGRLIQECEFWSKVLKNIELDSASFPINYFQLAESKNFFKRLRWILSIIFNYEFRRDIEAGKAYNENNYKLLETMTQVIKKHKNVESLTFLDTTKHAFRLFKLLQDPRFDIHVIQLVRHPCGYVYSHMKRKKHENFFFVISTITHWIFYNFLFKRIRKYPVLKGKNILIHYEDMAENPMSTLEKIGKLTSFDFNNMKLSDYNRSGQHIIGGSKIRFEKGKLKIIPDCEWKEKLPKFYRYLLAPLNKLKF